MSELPKALGPAEVRERIARGEAICLLDVREHDEVAIARIEGSTHIPMNDVPARLAEMDPTAPTVVYCHHGMRSQMVANFLSSRGFAQVANLTGGIDLYAAIVDPKMARY